MKKTLCLNMIVKNESHIIEETLIQLLNTIRIDYWVISDTGSDDNTIQIILNTFKKFNIPGELYEDEWKNFGYNRSLALNYAYNKTDYLLIFDADDLIHSLSSNNSNNSNNDNPNNDNPNNDNPNNDNPNNDNPSKLITIDHLNKDMYYIPFNLKSLNYYRTPLVSNKIKWKFFGVTHEYIENLEPINGSAYINDLFFIEARTCGNRSKNLNKYIDDALILENAYDNIELYENDLQLRNRYGYYCGQSFHDGGNIEKAIKWFEKTIESDYYLQYKYNACVKCGDCYNNLGNHEKALVMWEKSYEFDNMRPEGISRLMEYYYENERHLMVCSLYKKFKHLTIDASFEDKIFLDTKKYELIHYYPSISGYYCNENKDAYDACKYLLLHRSDYMNITINNLRFYISELNDDNDNEFIDFCIKYINDKTNLSDNRQLLLNICKDRICKNRINKNDIDIVISQTGCSSNNAIVSLLKNNNIVDAIINIVN